MLRNLGIRSKILATLSIPVLLLFIVAGVLIKNAMDQRSVAKSYVQVLTAGSQFTQLVQGLQAERSLSLAVQAGDVTKQAALKQTRDQISKGLDQLSKVDNPTGDSKSSKVLNDSTLRLWGRIQASNKDVDRVRQQLDSHHATTTQINNAYSGIINNLLQVPTVISQQYPVLSMQRALSTATVNQTANEALMRERDLLTPFIAAGGYKSVAEQQAGRAGITRHQIASEQADQNANATGRTLNHSNQLSTIENKMATQPVGQDPQVSESSYTGAVDTESNNLRNFQNQQYAIAQDDVDQIIDDANRRLTWTILGSLLVLAAMVLLALHMSRSIAAPLRRLTKAVDRVHTRLPQMVNQDDPDQRVTLSDDMVAPVESGDEIGRLASSFNDVNRTVVETANSQAALRSSIAGMFVNVARRDQSLLTRQLGLIDQLERTEEDPQTLSTLFKLDHLSTRMRRNAEALLVLAGIDTGRRLRRPMALSDVIRTASSEIEHYDRVDLIQTVDPQMLGHTALAAASMLAELLENATAFSDPNSRVTVRTENSPSGVAVIITDEGLGMSDTEIEEANTKISSVSLAEVVASKRIGFFVVGRLSRRLESSVTVSRGAGKGTMVRVEFPPQVFVPSAVTHVLASAAPAKALAAASEASDAQSSGTDSAAAKSTAPTPARHSAPRPTRRSQPQPQPMKTDAGARPSEKEEEKASPSTPSATGETQVGPRQEKQQARGGLFAGLRRARSTAPEAATTTSNTPDSSSAASDAATTGTGGSTAPAPELSAPGQRPTETPQRPAPDAAPSAPTDRPSAPTASPADPPRPTAEPATPAEASSSAATSAGLARRQPKAPASDETTAPPVPPTPASPSGARDILPSSARKPAPGRGSLFSRMGEAAGAAGQSGATPATGQKTTADTPSKPEQDTPLPVRRPPQDAPVQSAPVAMGAAASGFAAEALSELSRLQAYRPATMATAESGSSAPSTLVRRQAGATPAGQLPPPKPQPTAARRSRSAADVRSMLSGFQAGVERGRSSNPDSPAESGGSGSTS